VKAKSEEARKDAARLTAFLSGLGGEGAARACELSAEGSDGGIGEELTSARESTASALADVKVR